MRKGYGSFTGQTYPVITLDPLQSLQTENENLKRQIATLKAENHALKSKPQRGWLGRLWHPDDDVVEIGFKLTRDKVFEAIDSERKHMTWIGHTLQPISTYMLLMEHYLLKARDQFCCSKKPPLDELDNIRKVAALATACMEGYGAPKRVKSKAHPIPGQPDKHEER